MKAGETRAMTKLAWLHERGQGVRVNKRKALELYTEAAMRGESEAQYRLAMYHLKGS
jgi:TPR repeat protein